MGMVGQVRIVISNFENHTHYSAKSVGEYL